MEEIYVVKIKKKPEPSKLYPSERRYSALTVGGMGLVHILLAVTSLLLAGLGAGGPGIALGVAGCITGVVGILAWQRWYVDNNIRYFFFTSIISCLVAIICTTLTIVCMANAREEMLFNARPITPPLTTPQGDALIANKQEQQIPVSLPLTMPQHDISQGEASMTNKQEQQIPISLPLTMPQSDTSQGEASMANKQEQQIPVSLPLGVPQDVVDTENSTASIVKFIAAFENRRNRSDFEILRPNETYLLRLNDDRPNKTTSFQGDSGTETTPSGDQELGTVATESTVPEEVVTEVLQDIATSPTHPWNASTINILIASVLELGWSLLSLRIAWKGMTNRYSSDDTVLKARETSYLPWFLRTNHTRPDILDNHKTTPCQIAVVSNDIEQYLPQQESAGEYHERVRQFLASNQTNT